MSLLPKISLRLWPVVLVCACGFLIWIDRTRIQRVEYVSELAGGIGPVEASSSTGYLDQQRKLIVPERNERSFEWIAQTQQMFAQGEARVRHVAYDNAPQGRKVNAPSPYRWWLGLVAWCDHAISGRPLGLAVEHAALWADPALHGLLLIGGSLFVAWRFSRLAAGFFAIGVVALFPFAGGFLPGVPDHHGLARIASLSSVFLFLAGSRSGPHGNHWFGIAGVVGGLALWLDVSIQVPVTVGITLGGLLAAGVVRRKATESPVWLLSARSWRVWSASGAATVLLAYFAEYFPGHLGSWHLELIHPVYGVAWVGVGELMARITVWTKDERASWKSRDLPALVLSLVAIAAVPMAMHWSGSQGYFARDLLSVRLTNQPDGVVAMSFWSWLNDEGTKTTVWAAVLPMVMLIPAGWTILSKTRQLEFRASLAFAFGPVLIALGFACQQLSWWSMLDGAWLVLMVIIASESPPGALKSGRLVWLGVAILTLVPGVIQLLPQRVINSEMPLSSAEAEELIERHLAQWLVKRSAEKDAIVYAPPHETVTLSFYGGLRGIGTFAADNTAGFGTALMIAGAKTMEEVQAMIQARDIRFIVVPSWDPFFEEFGRLYLAGKFSNRKSFFIGELRRFNLPPWLSPLAYPMPVIGGFEKQSVLVFEVIDEANPAVAASRLAEYLVETGELNREASVDETLRRFPGDVGALAALVQLQNAQEDKEGATRTWAALLARLANGADRFLPWDRRVSLAVVLARGEKIDLAREQTRRCVAEIDGRKLRSLSPGALYRLMVLSHSFGFPWADPKMRELALDLLPADLRAAL